MRITQAGSFYIATLPDITLPESDREKLLALATDEYTDEFSDMLDEALPLAAPAVLFGVCAASDADSQSVCVGGVRIASALAAEKLSGRNRCFPYVATCGTALETWSKQYAGDFLAEYWADEIKKYFMRQVLTAHRAYLKETYHITGHLTALNPGSVAAWPISGQQALFDILGGKDFVQAQIGVTYTDSFLMLPTKSVSGIAFESEVFYENCQFCPLEKCPGRRAPRIKTE